MYFCPAPHGQGCSVQPSARGARTRHRLAWIDRWGALHAFSHRYIMGNDAHRAVTDAKARAKLPLSGIYSTNSRKRPQPGKPLAIVGTGPPSSLIIRLGTPISGTRAPHPALQQRRAALNPADEPHMECRVGQRSCSPGKRPEAQHIDRWDRSGCGFEVRSRRWHSPAPAARPRSTT